MRKILAYPLTIIHLIIFGLILVVFHLIQWVCFNVFGYQAHKKSVDFLNYFLTKSLLLLGTRVTFNNQHQIHTEQPCIIVSNHQSMYDIPPIIWHMRKHHPKFISKKELGKGIPSISYNLRHGGSVLIDRKNREQSLKEILKLAIYAEKNNRSVVIFPEGTRSRTGKPKRFQSGGLKILMKKMPNALIVPVSISNSWKTLRYGKFPMGIGNHITFEVHQPVKVNELPPEELIASVEKTITSHVKA
ncbi:lysophospholipid acyltransferase family protein [Galbibacter sp. EGI 63066]|uniref:lysophospholipid acyltransferase family protein n=1 Tax=Galbibacter sp. EGI 63066 TaxID=2993559 RepID=UPI00224953E3|nr:lysophospholipid acyltransferase family protein [Galbibacter sp. EGI 63066]MCX2681269.1 lysophospholipid acyltransferase family protein [Galbibacter sp. EGI 63066]